jgi:hypothetical protein
MRPLRLRLSGVVCDDYDEEHAAASPADRP